MNFLMFKLVLEKAEEQESKLPTTAGLSHASEVMLKILQARLQQYVDYEIADVHAGFRKGRGNRDQIEQQSLGMGSPQKLYHVTLLLVYQVQLPTS